MQAPLLLRTEGWAGRGVGLALGALAVLGQAPFHIWPITLLSLACLFGRLQWAAEAEHSGRRGFSAAIWWALGYFAAGTFWVGSAFVERGPEFIPIMPFMVAGLAALLALFWGLAGAFFARAKLSGFWAVLVFTASFTVAELTRGHIFGGFPWNLPAYIFEAGTRPSQIARWIGAYGLSALVLMVSAALGQALFWREKRWPVALAILPVWPEGAVRGFRGPAMDDPDLLNAVGGLLANEDSEPPVWLMNSLQTEMERGRTRYYNVSVAITFDANGVPTVAGTNRKRKLVAFGEHIPFMDWFEDVQFPLISTNLASISPAKEKRLSDFPGLPRLSPQLCYEVAFPGLTPNGAGRPAEFILNQSNDAWFGKSAGPAQHANTARYRAIETGLPIIRAASNGMSGQIDPYGRVHGEVVEVDINFIDTKLLKPLIFNDNIKFLDLALLLISLLICVITPLVRLRGVGLRA